MAYFFFFYFFLFTDKAGTILFLYANKSYKTFEPLCFVTDLKAICLY